MDAAGPSFRASGHHANSFCGLDTPAWDIPDGTPIDSCSLGLDDVPSLDVGANDEVPDFQSSQGRWKGHSQRKRHH